MRNLIGLIVLLLLVIALALAFGATAEAGSYTVTTSNREDTLIAAEVTRINERRGTTLTNQDWVQDQVNDSLRPLKQADRAQEAAQACATFVTLSAPEQSQITALLGGKSPCP